MSDKKIIIRNCPAIYGIDDGFFVAIEKMKKMKNTVMTVLIAY